MYKRSEFDEYFTNLGATVVFNPQGLTPELIDQFIAETQSVLDDNATKQSMWVKPKIYNKLLGYELKMREKYTGFESFVVDDIKTRRAIKKQNPIARVSEMYHHKYGGVASSSKKPYVQLLADELKSFDNRILFMSGGMDSEFLATVMCDAHLPFTPVIFKWVDQYGNEQNAHDTKYAFEFCARRLITPIVKTLNVQELWLTPEFMDFAVKFGFVSAHVATYGYITTLMLAERPQSTFLFGGEIRYNTTLDIEDEVASQHNIVFASKITYPAGYAAISTGGGGYNINASTSATDPTNIATPNPSQATMDSLSGRDAATQIYLNEQPGQPQYYSFVGPRYANNWSVQTFVVGAGGGGGGAELVQSAPISARGGGGGGGGQCNATTQYLSQNLEIVGYLTNVVPSGARFTGTVGVGGQGGVNGPGSAGGDTTFNAYQHTGQLMTSFSRKGGGGGGYSTANNGGYSYDVNGVMQNGGAGTGLSLTYGGGGGGRGTAGFSLSGNSGAVAAIGGNGGVMHGIGIYTPLQTKPTEQSGAPNRGINIFPVGGGGGGGAGIYQGSPGYAGAAAQGIWYTPTNYSGTLYYPNTGSTPINGAAGSGFGSLVSTNNWGGGPAVSGGAPRSVELPTAMGCGGGGGYQGLMSGAGSAGGTGFVYVYFTLI